MHGQCSWHWTQGRHRSHCHNEHDRNTSIRETVMHNVPQAIGLHRMAFDSFEYPSEIYCCCCSSSSWCSYCSDAAVISPFTIHPLQCHLYFLYSLHSSSLQCISGSSDTEHCDVALLIVSLNDRVNLPHIFHFLAVLCCYYDKSMRDCCTLQGGHGMTGLPQGVRQGGTLWGMYYMDCKGCNDNVLLVIQSDWELL